MRNRALVLPFVVIFGLALASTFLASSATAAAPPGPFFQGFEKNTEGWFDTNNGGGPYGTIARRPSGYTNSGAYADGIRSSDGKWHARISGTGSGPFTRWGGYTSTFPQGGYLTQVDIYLDVAWAASHPGTDFDWSSAINESTPSTPTHRRDFIFNAGTQRPTDLIPGFWVNVSNNGGTPPWSPCNGPDPVTGCRTPVFITQSGWYTFRHVFRADSFATCTEPTCLVVDFDILRGKDTTAHWTLHSAQDPMSMVGGNRYGWFDIEQISDLAIDNSLRTNLCKHGHGEGKVKKAHFKVDKDSCKKDGDVEEDDDDSASHFQSTSITSATFTLDEDSQTLTMIGTGLNNGLPVAFTMVAVDNGGAAPAVFTLILSDGYTITGPLEEGSITIE